MEVMPRLDNTAAIRYARRSDRFLAVLSDEARSASDLSVSSPWGSTSVDVYRLFFSASLPTSFSTKQTAVARRRHSRSAEALPGEDPKKSKQSPAAFGGRDGSLWKQHEIRVVAAAEIPAAMGYCLASPIQRSVVWCWQLSN